MKHLIHFLTVCSFLIPGLPVVGAQEGTPVLVETMEAIPTDLIVEEVALTGTVVSKRRAGLSARADGLVAEVFVDAGSRVEKGDRLLQLDTRLAEIELDLIRAEIEAAKVEAADAKREWEEVRNLTDSGAFSRTEAASREAMVRIREAQLSALRAREEQQEEQIKRHALVAPFSGYIVRKETEAGEWVDTGAAVLALVQTDELWFDLQVAQEFLPSVQKAERAAVVLDAHTETKLEARIDIIVPVKDPVSRTFLTRLVFDDPGRVASPGMSGTALLQVRPEKTGSITVPRDAVMRFPDGSAKVWTVVTDDGMSVARPVAVRTSGSIGETVEVTDGLKGGEKVVVRGNEDLSEGQLVEIRELGNTTAGGGL